jgi:hypothetical protein
MPPGIIKRNSKRKVSEGADEQEFSEEQSLIAGRQTRQAALKSHRVWDTLKPGAGKHAEMDEEMSSESPGFFNAICLLNGLFRTWYFCKAYSYCAETNKSKRRAG